MPRQCSASVVFEKFWLIKDCGLPHDSKVLHLVSGELKSRKRFDIFISRALYLAFNRDSGSRGQRRNHAQQQEEKSVGKQGRVQRATTNFIEMG